MSRQIKLQQPPQINALTHSLTHTHTHTPQSNPVISIQDLPLISHISGESVASINVCLRLALPVSELYKLFLERHPIEKAFIQEQSRKLLESNLTAAEQARTIEIGTALGALN